MQDSGFVFFKIYSHKAQLSYTVPKYDRRPSPRRLLDCAHTVLYDPGPSTHQRVSASQYALLPFHAHMLSKSTLVNTMRFAILHIL